MCQRHERVINLVDDLENYTYPINLDDLKSFKIHFFINQNYFCSNFRLNIRPLGAILTTLLLFLAYKQVYPNAKLQIPYEVQTNLNTLYENFAKLRKDKPGTFCAVISGGLFTIAIAGHVISGTWLVLGILIGIFFLCAKYQIRLVNGDVAGK